MLRPPARECVSCLDEFSARETVRAPCHNYCRDCFGGLVAAACRNEQQWPPKCCLNRIPDSTVMLGLGDAKLVRAWRDRGAEWGIPVGERVYCSRPDCSVWCRPDQVSNRFTGSPLLLSLLLLLLSLLFFLSFSYLHREEGP